MPEIFSGEFGFGKTAEESKKFTSAISDSFSTAFTGPIMLVDLRELILSSDELFLIALVSNHSTIKNLVRSSEQITMLKETLKKLAPKALQRSKILALDYVSPTEFEQRLLLK